VPNATPIYIGGASPDRLRDLFFGTTTDKKNRKYQLQDRERGFGEKERNGGQRTGRESTATDQGVSKQQTNGEVEGGKKKERERKRRTVKKAQKRSKSFPPAQHGRTKARSKRDPGINKTYCGEKKTTVPLSSKKKKEAIRPKGTANKGE